MSTKKKIFGKKRDKKERIDAGSIPAVLYGAKKENIIFSVNKKDFLNLYSEVGENNLIDLEIEDNKKNLTVLIYETQIDPETREIIHVDFYEPNLKEEVEAEVPLDFFGSSLAVEEESGTLVKNAYSVIVKALPESLPSELKVDIGKLKTFDDVIYVKDIDLPENVQITQDPDAVIAMVSAPEDVETELEKPIEEEGEVEVVGEKKDEEDDLDDESEKEKDVKKEEESEKE